jgi:hypothetical protein
MQVVKEISKGYIEEGKVRKKISELDKAHIYKGFTINHFFPCYSWLCHPCLFLVMTTFPGFSALHCTKISRSGYSKISVCTSQKASRNTSHISTEASSSFPWSHEWTCSLRDSLLSCRAFRWCHAICDIRICAIALLSVFVYVYLLRSL